MTFTEKERKWFKRWIAPYSKEEQIQRTRESIVVYAIVFGGLAFYSFYSSQVDPEDLVQVEGDIDSVSLTTYYTTRPRTMGLGKDRHYRILIALKGYPYPAPYDRGDYNSLVKLSARLKYSKHIKLYLYTNSLSRYTRPYGEIEPVYLEVDGEVLLSLERWRQGQRSITWLILGTGLVYILIGLLFWKADILVNLWEKWTNKGKQEHLADAYMQRFRNYPRKRLEEIANGKHRRPEAREGARRILKEQSQRDDDM